MHVSVSAGVADGATEDIWNNIKTDLLKTTEEVVKPDGGMSTWKRPLLPSRKLSRPGRLVKALRHHTMQPNALPDMQCTMSSCADKKVYKNIDPKSSGLLPC